MDSVGDRYVVLFVWSKKVVAMKSGVSRFEVGTIVSGFGLLSTGTGFRWMSVTQSRWCGKEKHTFGGMGEADDIACPSVVVSTSSANGSIVGSGTARSPTGAGAGAGGWNG